MFKKITHFGCDGLNFSPNFVSFYLKNDHRESLSWQKHTGPIQFQIGAGISSLWNPKLFIFWIFCGILRIYELWLKGSYFYYFWLTDLLWNLYLRSSAATTSSNKMYLALASKPETRNFIWGNICLK